MTLQEKALNAGGLGDLNLFYVMTLETLNT